MRSDVILKIAEKFDGTKYVDIFVQGRTEAYGLGKIKLCNVSMETDMTGEVDTVTIVSEHGDATFHLEPAAIMGFVVVKPEGDE